MPTEEKRTATGWMAKIMADDSRSKLVVVVGIAGMALVLLSTLWGGSDTASGQQSESISVQKYISATENRLESLLGSVEGVGRVRVMITLENGVETVYARDEKQSTDRMTHYLEDHPAKLEEKEDSEKKYIMVDGNGGRRQALQLKQLEPIVKGVVVVCAGAQNAVTRACVTDAVTTALGIRYNRVCVVPSVT